MTTNTRFYVAGHALIERRSSYLVTRRSKSNDYMPFKWDIPGGIVKSGETLEDAIRREVREETRIGIRVGSVISVYSNRDQLPVRQTFQITYQCKYVDGEVYLNPSEHDMFQWLDYKSIASLDMIDFLRELVRSYHPVPKLTKHAKKACESI